MEDSINQSGKKIKIKDYQRTDNYVDQHPGRVTATILKPMEVPVKWIIKLPGLRSEHTQLRYDMEKVKKLSELVTEESFRKKHPIELEVHHDGKVFIFDGNHRAKAAKLAGLESYPAIVRFYGGGEDYVNLDKVLKNHPISKDANDMNKKENKLAKMDILVAKAKLAIKAGFDYDQIMEEMMKLASESGGNEGGDTDTEGGAADQGYQNNQDSGLDYAGENDVNKGNTPQVGPRDMGDIKSAFVDAIRNSNRLYAEASHVEVIEVPLKDLGLDKDLDYGIRANEEAAFTAVQKYLSTHVYKTKLNFTLVRLEHEDSKFFVHVLVFDRHISNASANNDTNDSSLKILSNVSSNSIQKTAWRKRETVALGTNDETGLVKCPIEGGFLTRSCGTCPLAGNPHTYITDGSVECHFDDMTSWLSGNSVKEHRLRDNSSNT